MSYFGTSIKHATKTQTSLRKCAFSIQHWPSMLRYVKHLTVINFVSHDSNHNLEKGPFVYKFVYKQTLLSKFTQLFNAVVCMAFLK